MNCPRPTVSEPTKICDVCSALPTEPCPLKDLSAELLTEVPIGATKIGEDDGVCEACQ